MSLSNESDPTEMLRFQTLVHGTLSNDGQRPLELTVTFDHACSCFRLLPRMFVEPDGSFVCTGTTDDGQPWQVDGNLIDRGDVLAYVELKGACPAPRLDELLRALGWPDSPLVFQLPRQGVFLGEAEFRRLAESRNGAG